MLKRLFLCTLGLGFMMATYAQNRAPGCPDGPCGPAKMVSGPGPSVDVACGNSNSQACVNIYTESKLKPTPLADVAIGSKGTIELLDEQGKPFTTMTFEKYEGFVTTREGIQINLDGTKVVK